MDTQRKIELLAPAKNKEFGIQAILHGADAVYIGVQGFSARATAGNSVEDIAELTAFAHLYHARVYVALNTILYNSELSQVEALIWQLYRAQVDAIIVQDMGIMQLNLPPIPLHASTQTDNRTVEKAIFLEKAGFSQIVLARELSMDEISHICAHVSVPIEVFIHGALCVSYSGQCYISQDVTGRSANRGECSQMCRLPYDLYDADGKQIQKNTHFLSLKDFNQYAHIEKLLDAGVTSLKIEGRLKDISYVKNVVSAYRNRLDEIFERRPEFVRSSSGKVSVNFQPDLSKSFNRGFTDFFSEGRQKNIWSFDSPKSLGEYIGTVRSVSKNALFIDTQKTLNNGDGLCFLGKEGLTGFRINRAENNTIFPTQMPDIQVKTALYRNYNHLFETQLAKSTAQRNISAHIRVWETPFGFALQITDEDNCSATIAVEYEKNLAQKPQKENIKTQLAKTGNTIFEITDIAVLFEQEWFVPSSVWSDWRKQLINKLMITRAIRFQRDCKKIPRTTHRFVTENLTYLGNVSNDKSREFYAQHSVQVSQPAFEQIPQKNVPLMYSKHCIKYAMGWCPKENNKQNAFREPFYLVNNGNRFKLTFDCKRCEMQITKAN